MLNSMTGSGEARVKTDRFTAVFQVNSVNNRFLDLKFNSGRYLAMIESEFAETAKKHLRRGKVEVFFNVTFDSSGFEFKFDDAMLKSMLKEAGRVSKKFGIKKDITLSDILSVKGVFTGTESQFTEKDTAVLKKTFEKAVLKLVSMRVREGANLEKDIRRNLDEITRSIAVVRKELPRLEEGYKNRLMEKARTLKDEFQIDQNRIVTEVALLMSKSDITEELTRLESHVGQFIAFLGETDPVGRRLDFLSQELLREVNTIGSKISDEKVSSAVIRLKDCLERIREQVQNVE